MALLGFSVPEQCANEMTVTCSTWSIHGCVYTPGTLSVISKGCIGGSRLDSRMPPQKRLLLLRRCPGCVCRTLFYGMLLKGIHQEPLGKETGLPDLPTLHMPLHKSGHCKLWTGAVVNFLPYHLLLQSIIRTRVPSLHLFNAPLLSQGWCMHLPRGVSFGLPHQALSQLRMPASGTIAYRLLPTCHTTNPDGKHTSCIRPQSIGFHTCQYFPKKTIMRQ